MSTYIAWVLLMFASNSTGAIAVTTIDNISSRENCVRLAEIVKTHYVDRAQCVAVRKVR